MIPIRYTYSGKSFDIEPYNTAQEREILILSMLGQATLGGVLSICGVSNDVIESLTEEEQIAMLFKFRSISIGDDINLKFTCKKCNSGNENGISIENVIYENNISNPLIIDRFRHLTSDNFKDFITKDIDELELDEYESLYKEVSESITKFDTRKPIICQKCGHTNHVRIDNPLFVIDNMSEDSIMGLYQTYNDLTFFGHYTKQDIDSLYPFERTILISLLNKTREELNK